MDDVVLNLFFLLLLSFLPFMLFPKILGFTGKAIILFMFLSPKFFFIFG